MEHHCSRPTVEQTEQRVRELKEAGFNAIKFCLVVPPDYVLDICDRMGIYCYIQYPIWEPVESEEFFTRCYQQLPELVEKDRNHPSVILSDFACELVAFSSEMDAFMKFMVEKAKEIRPQPPLCRQQLDRHQPIRRFPHHPSLRRGQ